MSLSGLGTQRAAASQRSLLNATFARLCAIPSPSGNERACADAVIAELAALGVHVEEDDAAQVTGGNCGNLYAHVGPDIAPTLLLCTHLDTVPLAAPVEPVLVDDGWENANDAILGADNKAAVAVALELARWLLRERPDTAIELVFTVCEERSLQGCAAFDLTRLRSTFGYVFDHATPIGEIITASPTHYGLQATLRGSSAHAGIRPQDGRSAVLAAAHAIAAMALGRLDAQSTANIGLIRGGDAINVIPGICTIEGEARSLDPQRAREALTAMVDALTDAANLPHCECDLDVKVQKSFDGFVIPTSARSLHVAQAALSDCGYAPYEIASGGASDANVFVAAGFDCLNLANGTERAHQPDERVSVVELEAMLDVALALVQHADATL